MAKKPSGTKRTQDRSKVARTAPATAAEPPRPTAAQPTPGPVPGAPPARPGAGPAAESVSKAVAGKSPAEVPAAPPAPPEIPSRTPEQAPGRAPVELPPTTLAEIPSQAPVEVPMEMPEPAPGRTPVELARATPAEIPNDLPVELPPGQPQIPLEPPAETPVEVPDLRVNGAAPAASTKPAPAGVTAAAATGSKTAASRTEAVPQHAAEPRPRPAPVIERARLEPTPAPTWADPYAARPEPVSEAVAGITLEPDREPVPEQDPPTAGQHRPSLYIVQITPEMAPVAKVGGLADVVFGLSRELAIRGNHVEIILPKYDNLRYDHIFELHEVYRDLSVPWYEGAIHCTVYFGFVHDRKCFFIEPHSQDNFFNRGSIYGFRDDVMRFAFFSRAAMEYLWKAGKHPDIIHCHDWQTALVPVFLYELYQPMGMTHPRACLTIHNFAHQGLTGAELLRATGLHRPERYFDYHRLRDNRYVNALNLLKGGIVYSNFVTTVSPRYAFETKDQGQGFGLEPTLHTHHMKYGGVVNGIDYDVWNPEVDHLIPARYSIATIDDKYANKRALRQRLMLADNEKPVVAFIGRLDPQKGLDLLRHAIFYSLERGAQFVLLGSSPDPVINGDFWGLKRMLNDSPDCHLEVGFDEELSHLIYAGADLMLVPSRFEPCGLTQLISLRYGTIPVVRAVGGLADTVFDKDYSSRPLHERNGYVFQDYDLPGLESALGRAIACYFKHPDHFRELMKNAMRTDYSWNTPGQDYLNIYDYIRNK